MLKHLKFSGVYRDERLSVQATLENPADYGLEAKGLMFSTMVMAKGCNLLTPEDFSFYLMDEANHLYNTRRMATPDGTTSVNEDRPDGLIITDFNHEFLYQDMRLAFYYQPDQRFGIIELRH